MVAAQSEAAVRRLRERKHREEKPLALMFPGLDAVRGCCEIAPLEERLLASPEAPIVLLRRRRHPGGGRSAAGEAIAGSVAPANPYLGVMLPYTPLHHLLLGALGRPVVATSGNLSDEPICIAEHEAVDRLGGMADLFLVHNRPIVRHVDDSIVREVAGREMVLRRARGYAPLPIALAPTPAIPAATAGRSGPAEATPAPTPVVLAVGAHLKNTVALAVGPRVFLSQHIGDLETVEALRAFRRVLSDFPRLYAVAPAVVVADTHPDYVSRKEAQGLRLPLQAVQHHYAHVLACLAENELAGPVLGVAWDGTGYGADGTIWGGEFLLSTRTTFERVAWLRPFPLPGGDRAVHEPRRAALGLLHEAYGERAFARAELATLQAFRAAELPALQGMLAAGLRCPRTSSVGRLFDAVASLAGLRQLTHYEGQAAMELEFALPHDASHRAYPLPLVPARRRSAGARAAWVLDWVPLLEALLVDLQARTAIGEISARFHNALTEAVVNVARQTGQNQVALTGGCFQNLYLLECVVARLQAEGFRPYWHQRVPPNDGGIALGQAVAGLSAAAGGGNR
jgi:hydrogenase maturation protein HypF